MTPEIDSLDGWFVQTTPVRTLEVAEHGKPELELGPDDQQLDSWDRRVLDVQELALSGV